MLGACALLRVNLNPPKTRKKIDEGFANYPLSVTYLKNVEMDLSTSLANRKLNAEVVHDLCKNDWSLDEKSLEFLMIDLDLPMYVCLLEFSPP